MDPALCKGNETSDRSQEKWLSLTVRYVEPSSFQIRVDMLQLINLDALDCSPAYKVFKPFDRGLCFLNVSSKQTAIYWNILEELGCYS